MNLTPSQLITWSLVLLAIALLVAAATLIVNEVIRAQRNRTIGRAILRGVAAVSAETPPVPQETEAVAGNRLSDIDLPLHWLNTRIGKALVTDEDRRLIDQCGFSTQRAQLVFLVSRIALAIVLPVTVHLFWGTSLSERYDIAALACAFVVGFMAPKWTLGWRAGKRRESVGRELPLFVDLLRLLQGVGLSLDQSLQIMATDFSHVLRVLGYELTLANRQYARGRTREHSLQRLATLHNNENLRGLVSLLVQVDRHGGAVQEPLRQFSERLREHRRSEMKERIGKITVKMTGIMVTTLLPALVIVTAGPGFLAVIRSLGALTR